jgi:small subunit ribosomal protein S16
MKRLGRRHRPFFRICAMDAHTPRDGKAIEELGTYDPMVRDVDARAVLSRDRIDYWLSVGAKPTEKVAVLIKKYGTDGTHLEQQQAALERLEAGRRQAIKVSETSQPAAADEASPAESTEPAEETS